MVFFRDIVPEPWIIVTKIKVSDRVDVRTDKGFEYELTNILFFVTWITKALHIENLDGRVVVDNLFK